MTLTIRSDSDVEPIEPSQLPIFVRDYTISQYFQVAILSVLVYDTLITMDKETRYFWKPPRKPVDLVYFVNRYVGIIGATSTLYFDSFSATLPLLLGNFAVWTFNISNWITIISIDYILMIRVLALCSHDRKMSLFLKTFLLLEAASKIGFIAYLNIQEHVAVSGFADMTFCSYDNVPPWRLGVVSWLIPLAYGTLLMVLALYKAAEYWKMSSGFKGFTLVKVLIQDQVIYYALITVCCVLAILQFRVWVSNSFLSDVVTNLGNPAFLCILGSRMLFNLKKAGERGQNEGTSYRIPSQTVSNIDFDESVNPQRESEMESGGSARTA